jgi:hypothetical protein
MFVPRVVVPVIVEAAIAFEPTIGPWKPVSAVMFVPRVVVPVIVEAAIAFEPTIGPCKPLVYTTFELL